MASRELVMWANRTGTALLPDNDQWTNRFEVHSETSSRVYIIAQNKANKTWGCSCMGWKRHRNCKHLGAVMPALRQITAH